MNFNIGKIIFGLINPHLFLKQIGEQNKNENFNTQFAQTTNLNNQINAQNITTNNLIQNQPAPILNSQMSAQNINNKPAIQENEIVNSDSSNRNTRSDNIKHNIENLVKMTENKTVNNFSQTDRSAYIKTLLGLPQDLGTILQSVQNPNKPLIGGTLGLTNMNPSFFQTPKVISELFEELNPTIQNSQDIINIINTQTKNAQVQKDTVALMFSGMISLPEISKLILHNSKQAVAALIIAMATSSKNGVNNKYLQDTLSVINSCISMAESDNSAQTLKSLMMLYLPWLPLNEGIGFDLEITTPDGENDSNNSKLTVLIQTQNYGNLKGVFTLTTSNSVDIYIICSDKFPKKLLQKTLMSESSAHAMNTNIDIEELTPVKEELNETRETKVNLSATNEMNPYLLLMAHSFIRNTILIDNGELISETEARA